MSLASPVSAGLYPTAVDRRPSRLQGLSIAVPHLVLDELYGHFRQCCLSNLFPPLVFQLQLDILLWKILTLPLSILRVNAVATNCFPSPNPLANLRALVQQEGGFWSIWSNWRYVQTVLLDWVVHNVGNLVFKHWVFPAIFADPEQNSPFIWSTRVAVIVLVTVAYQSFSTIQARLRITDATALLPDGRALVSLRKKPYAGVLDCAQVVVREEGWAALFRGLKEATWIGGPALMSAAIAGWIYSMGIQAGLSAGKSI